MKKKIIVLFALFLANSLYASWPMESVDRYNIVLVDGAADRWQGLDCENGNGGNQYTEAYRNQQGVVTDSFGFWIPFLFPVRLGIRCSRSVTLHTTIPNVSAA